MAAKYFHHKTCNICNSSAKKIIHRLGKQNLVTCQNCSLTYFDKQRVDVADLYNDDYYSSGNDSQTSNYADYSSQQKVIKKNFRFAYSFIGKQPNKKKKMLEIGAGFGYFAENLPHAIQYEANEISDEALKHMQQKKIKTYRGDFSKIRFQNKYDYIMAFDVIEHPVDLKKFLNKVSDLLVQDGYFIFTTPDFKSIPNKLFGKRAPTIQPLYHNYYFDKKWLQTYLPKFGLEVVSVRTVYINYLSIGQIVLLGSFALPFIPLKNIVAVLKKMHLADKILPSFRFGGIECIVRKK